jgi:succinyl-diaminopimelate desuccinylase
VYKAARAVTRLEGHRFEVAPDPLLGRPTLNVGTIAGGLNVNSVPDEAVIGIDIRTTPAQRHAAVRAELERLLGDEVELSPIVDVEALRSDADHPWIRQVFELATPLLGQRPVQRAASYFTDASMLTPAFGGIPTVILGPGELALCHQTDEYCLASRVQAAAALYRELAGRWSTP